MKGKCFTGPSGPRAFAASRVVYRVAVGSLLCLGVSIPTGRADAQATPADQRPTVAIMPYFTNGAVMNHAEYDALGKGISDVLITELATNPALRVIERDRVQQLLDEQNLGASGRVDKETAAKIG